LKLIKGDGAQGDNPHVWLSVSLHIRQIENVASQLAKADAAHAAPVPGKRRRLYCQTGKTARRHAGGLKTIRTRNIITFHEAFPYFAKEFGLHIAAVTSASQARSPMPGAG